MYSLHYSTGCQVLTRHRKSVNKNTLTYIVYNTA